VQRLVQLLPALQRLAVLSFGEAYTKDVLIDRRHLRLHSIEGENDRMDGRATEQTHCLHAMATVYQRATFIHADGF